MSDFQSLGYKILNDTIVSLKGEYAAIPQSVKDAMPKAALLIAEAYVAGDLDDANSASLKHAMSMMANVKVGGQIALSELMLNTAANILAAGLGFIRKLVGI